MLEIIDKHNAGREASLVAVIAIDSPCYVIFHCVTARWSVVFSSAVTAKELRIAPPQVLHNISIVYRNVHILTILL